MKRLFVSIVLLAVVCLLAVPEVFAQRGAMGGGSGGWGMGGGYARFYDPKTVETTSGQVTEVDQTVFMKGMRKGVHLTLNTGKESVSVHVGPIWYLENQDVKIEKGDKIEVTGSRITFDGKPAIIAAEIEKGGQTLKLRDENGVPVWAGWRRK